jgi:hypothetical protein
MVVFLTIVIAILAVNGLILMVLSRQFAPTKLSRTPREERVENYSPMLRLLDCNELLYLRNQPGFTRQMELRLRRQRATLFAHYLRSLQADFREACAALKVVMAQASTDRRDLASLVLRSQAQFAYRVATLRLQVVLYRWGVGAVDVAGVFAPFDALRHVLQTLTPVNQTGAI